MDLLSSLFSFIYVKSRLDVARPAVSAHCIYQTIWSLQQFGVPLTSKCNKCIYLIF